MKKVMIIGSGLGGLCAGASLAKKGYEVTVFEQHYQIGGYATLFQRRTSNHKNVIYDVSLHGIGNLNENRNFYQRLHALGIFDDVTPLKKKETATIVRNQDEIDIPDDFNQYQNHFLQRYPAFKNGIKQLFDFLKLLDEDMENNVYKYNSIPKYFDTLSNQTLKEFVYQYVEDEDFLHEFGFLWLYYGLDPNELNALYYCLAWLGYHIGGTYYIQGGGNALAKSLANIIKRHDGLIFTNEKVIEIQQDHGVVTSITTNKQQTYHGDIFILNGDPITLLNCMNENAYTNKERSLFINNEIGMSLTQLYLAVDAPPQVYGLHKADYFFDDFEGLEFGKRYIDSADYNNTPIGIVNYNLCDVSLNPEIGFIALTVGDYISNWPKDKKAYQEQKAYVTDLLLKRLFSYFPKLKGHIINIELGTPRTMLRYSGNTNGAVYGFSQNQNHAGLKRPSVKGFLQNLYYASAWVQPGGGYEGVLRSGFMCSDLIVKNEKTRKDFKQPSLSSKNYIQGMIASANLTHTSGICASYALRFEDENTNYYFTIKHQKITLHQYIDTPDVEIRCTYATWFAIGQGALSGEEAYHKRLLEIQGDMEKFSCIPKVFAQQEEIQDANEPSYSYATIYIPLTLVPWIMFWILHTKIHPSYLSFFAILWILFIQYVLKPSKMRKATQLEGITYFTFSIHWLWSSIDNSSFIKYGHYLSLFLPILLLIYLKICPMTSEYAYYSVPTFMRKTKLFRIVNEKVTLVWIFVFFLQFLLVEVIFAPYAFSPIFYSIELIGILFSIFYPKKFMK